MHPNLSNVFWSSSYHARPLGEVRRWLTRGEIHQQVNRRLQSVLQVALQREDIASCPATDVEELRYHLQAIPDVVYVAQ